MKNIIFLLALIISISSCKKHKVDPVSKSAVLHVEYTATSSGFPGTGFQSKVDILFSGKTPVYLYSGFDKANVISQDVTIQGDQQVTINGYVIDSVGCGSNQSNVPVTLKLTYNGKVISDKSASGGCSGSVQYQGKLEFIN